MKKLSKILSFTSKAGFTMIELLVVIAVIGVLAVAVLSSINPIEQINKGRDTRTRSDAAQLINAIDRYYAIHEKYPWNVTNAPDYTAPVALLDLPNAAIDFVGAASTLITEHGLAVTYTDWDWVDVLVSTSEVKEGFTNRLKDDNKLFIGKSAGYNETMYACFMPTSKAFVQEAEDNCTDGTTTTPIAGVAVCDIGGGTDDLICLP
ncbi:MAG: type II secretion system protein [Candidatus Pacebacteria bacterium]|jgi:prepilin-type N-terminal cleavage/methylation domain-containing protein|nr:type II secretion system protein [Candidatus Paceibacterota bacterium]MBT3511934.1 type II secretion system protein [Candidatus Paceibacterota bacterium]MBT4005256.1 type II secretion system protein [Candidatus Paceibacterota bacterium]MBT4358976.1 type II secretion system protein [Candidatus Paceibacterota bacterium]MBT4680459.1 type II secretion system protein [Candidatus Paceibacterota bacterium]